MLLTKWKHAFFLVVKASQATQRACVTQLQTHSLRKSRLPAVTHSVVLNTVLSPWLGYAASSMFIMYLAPIIRIGMSR
jgi:hypothetical protein